ncbi:MAG: cobyric acid synthase, partial [Brachymonas sp.]|nr:cobyric acid synthase [Brachymonas sp.]
MPVPNPANHPHFAASCAADSVAQAAAHSQTSACLPARAPAVCIMVLGCTSGAGKSWLATALCRWYANQGLRVAPFKAQNMSNNARVVPAPASSVCGAGSAGAEIGAAQYFQALAARVQPDVRMNPLLLKPESDTRSQVVLLGQVNPTLTALPWRERSSHVWPHITAALDALRAENDVVVIEGAGSPAEINLAASDVVNMRVARYCNAACMLVADIDRGGAFAHLYGTWAMLPHEADRQLLRGFVLNKFRGNASLLAPAPALLQQRTGLPVLATLPMWHNHGLPEEDSLFTATPPAAPQPHAANTPSPASANAEAGADAATATNASSTNTTPAAPSITIAIIAYPRSSNLDEFAPLA